MIKIYKLLFIITIFISGCKTPEPSENNIVQSIDNLNMNIFSSEGKKLFTIKSPKSIYSKEINTFNLNETIINLYKDNKSEYIISSDKSQLSNNNKLLELNGNVLVKTLFQQGDILSANSFKWNILNSEYLLVGNVKFENNLITLSSNKAILNKESNIIEFFNPVKYHIKDNNNEKVYEINSENAYYNINTKSVSFRSNNDRVRSKIYF